MPSILTSSGQCVSFNCHYFNNLMMDLCFKCLTCDNSNLTSYFEYLSHKPNSKRKAHLPICGYSAVTHGREEKVMALSVEFDYGVVLNYST